MDATIIRSIFRFYEEKRPLLWVEAAAEIAQQRPGSHFVVFGEGPLQQAARNAARARGIGKCFHTPGMIKMKLGWLLDLFSLTSAFEGTPNVILEASCLESQSSRPTPEALGRRLNKVSQGMSCQRTSCGNSEMRYWCPSRRAIEICVKTEGPRFVEDRLVLEEWSGRR